MKETTQEQWKAIPGFEGRYQVSSLGRVWSEVTKRVLRPAPTSKGYLSVQLYFNERPKRSRSHCVHDLVMLAFVGPKPVGFQVDHGREGKQCNATHNLEYVTPEENIRRAKATNPPAAAGTDHPNAKLTAAQVREIRRRSAAKTLRAETVAGVYGVSVATIVGVARNRTYRNVS